MKNIMIASIAILLTATAYAKNIELKLSSIYKEGIDQIQVTETKVLATLGKEFILPGKKGSSFELKLKVDENKAGFIVINAQILKAGGIVATSSKMITRYGIEGTISKESINADGKKESFNLKVIPINNKN